MTVRSLYIALIAAALLLGTAACDHSPEKKTTIAVVPKVDDASVATAKAAALAARETYDIRVRWDVSRTPTAESQAELIEKLVAAGVDGILISCIDADGVRDAIDKAIRAGVKVGTFDSDCPGSGRSFYIGSNNDAAGLLAATTLLALCAEAGRPADGIGVFGGVVGDAAMQERLESFLTAVPDTAATLWSGDNASTGKTQVTDFLTEYAGLPVNGVVFLSSTAVIDGPGGLARLDSLCRPATDNEGAAAAAVFFDTSDGVLDYVTAMPHCAAIRQDFGAMVTGGIDRLLKAIRNEPFGETVTFTPVEAVR
ncbi:MAG: substrate-binding domain-containing protein [Rikenellaceae bacterium]|nr:substrate-binding domain-containing protein [Rikenellaceae bacterium]